MNDTLSDTAQLVCAAAAGDQRASRALYDRYRPLIGALITKYIASEPKTSRDEVQSDVFLAFAEAVHSAASSGVVDAFPGHLRTHARKHVLERRARMSASLTIPARTLARYHAAREGKPAGSLLADATRFAVERALTPAVSLNNTRAFAA